MSRPLTIEDLRKCQLSLTLHLRVQGGSSYHYECVEHPHLTVSKNYCRKSRTTVTAYYVGGQECADLEAVVAALNAEQHEGGRA